MANGMVFSRQRARVQQGKSVDRGVSMALLRARRWHSGADQIARGIVPSPRTRVVVQASRRPLDDYSSLAGHIAAVCFPPLHSWRPGM